MSKALITEGYLTDIANAIRAKNGSADTYTPPQMAAAIAAIPTGSDVDVEPLNVTQNGTYTAPSGKAYSPVTALVPNTYGSGDEGKVVQNGALVAQTSRTLTQNGTYDTTTNDSVTVNVSGGGGGGNQEIATFYGWNYNYGYSAFGTLVKRDGTIYGRAINASNIATFTGDLFTLRCPANGTTALVLTALTAISVTIYTASTSSSEITPMTGDSYQLSADETKSIPNPNYSGGLIITAEAI